MFQDSGSFRLIFWYKIQYAFILSWCIRMPVYMCLTNKDFFAGSSTENDNLPKVDSPAEQKLVAETRAADCRTSEQKPQPLDEEKRDSGTNNGAASSLSNKSQSLQNWCKPIFSESSLIPGMEKLLIFFLLLPIHVVKEQKVQLAYM